MYDRIEHDLRVASPTQGAPVIAVPDELKPGYGECFGLGCHGLKWIVRPEGIAPRTGLFGRCQTCVDRDEAPAAGSL